MRHDETRDNTTNIENQSIEADAHADTREGDDNRPMENRVADAWWKTMAAMPKHLRGVDQGNTMRVSEITLGNEETLVETPTDANRIFAGPNGEEHRLEFIAEHGDVAVVWDQKFKVWRVPVFAEQRERFSNAKAKDIARWGSE